MYQKISFKLLKNWLVTSFKVKAEPQTQNQPVQSPAAPKRVLIWPLDWRVFKQVVCSLSVGATIAEEPTRTWLWVGDFCLKQCTNGTLGESEGNWNRCIPYSADITIFNFLKFILIRHFHQFLCDFFKVSNLSSTRERNKWADARLRFVWVCLNENRRREIRLRSRIRLLWHLTMFAKHYVNTIYQIAFRP